MVVTFTDAEMAAIKEAGRQRNQITTDLGVQNQRIDEGTDEELNIMGVKVEKAVAMLTGSPWSAVLDTPDGGVYDMILPDGRTCQVKGRKHVPPEIGWLFMKRLWPEADIVVLGQAVPEDVNSVEILGWVTREQFRERYHMFDFGRGMGPQPAVFDHELNPIETLCELKVKPLGITAFWTG